MKSPIDEVPYEDDPPFRMTPRTTRLHIAKLSKQGYKGLGLAVDVADDVVELSHAGVTFLLVSTVAAILRSANQS